ncbi:MAG: hypothetical protein AAFN93_21800 [Bacteroidota bacterium]
MPNISPQHNYSPTEEVDDNSDINKTISEEYRALFNLNHLTDPQAQRIEEILNLARQDKQLDLMITNIICQEGQNQGLASDSSLDSYKDQMAVLREYQETNFSGLDNTMFGNMMAVKFNSKDCDQSISEKDMDKIEAALQKEVISGIAQTRLYR